MSALPKEFIGYYVADGPIGYVEASTPEEAISIAKFVTQGWPRAQHSDPIRRLLFKTLYRVKIWTE